MENNKKPFTIEATVNGKSQQVQVATEETTDGVDFYKCSINGTEITQVRKEVEGWKQIWGDLSQEEVNNIGIVIEAYIEKNKITS
jgi:hypothetical protein